MVQKPESDHHELPEHHEDRMIGFLHAIIRVCVRALAILMVLVIMWGIADVVYVLYQRVMAPPVYLLSIEDIFYAFGAFMVVLIAIEIFINIRLYLESNVFPVKLVVATALMAIARKIIVLDVEKLSALHIFAIAFATLAVGLIYWLLHKEHVKRQGR